MTWVVDPPVRVGRWNFAMICDIEVSAAPVSTMVIASGRKTPRVVLGAHGDAIMAVGMDGRGWDTDVIEDLFPTAIAQFRKALDDRP